MALQNEWAAILARDFPIAEVRGNFNAGLPYLSPSSRVRPGQEPDAEGSVGVPATGRHEEHGISPKLPFGTDVTRSEFDSREVMQWTT